MTTIYAVSKGIYSDYGVIALFSSEDNAKLFMERHPTGDDYDKYNDLEIFELDVGVPKMREGFQFYWVQMRETGETMNCESDTSYVGERVDEELQSGGGGIGNRWFNWYGWVADSAHAVKCANEHRIMLLARPQVGRCLGEGHNCEQVEPPK